MSLKVTKTSTLIAIAAKASRTARVIQAGGAAILFSLLTSAPLHAVEIDWLGADGAWEDPANWPGGIVPTDEDFVRLPDGVTVSSSGSSNIAEELVARAKLNIVDGLFRVVGTIDAFDDFALFPNTTVEAGRIFIQAAGVFDVGPDARATVVEGVFSSGTVEIRDRGAVIAESFDNFNLWKIRSQGTAIANSMINHDNGVLEVFDSGSLFDINGNLTNNGQVRAYGGASAQVDSIENNASIEISSGAELTGASVENRDSVLITGPSTRWNAAIVTNHSGEIALNNSAMGEVGNFDNRARLEVDNSVLQFTDAINAVGGNIELRNNATATATNLLTNLGLIQVDETSLLGTETFQQLSGMTQINGGTLGANPAAASIIAGGSIAGFGNISGSLQVGENGLITPNGPAADPSGEFDITDGLSLAGVFNVDIGGTQAVDFDRLLVGSSANLAGTLSVSLVNGFTPVLGDFFDIILAQSVIGDFENISLPSLANGLRFEASNQGSFYRLEITAVPVPPILPAFLLAVFLLRNRKRSIV